MIEFSPQREMHSFVRIQLVKNKLTEWSNNR